MKRITTLLIALFLILTGSLRADEASTPLKDVYVVHLVLDGANANFFHKLMSDGKLPTVQNAILRNGAHFTHAVNVFPYTTSSSYQSFVTGLFPGSANIPHLEWFDRSSKHIVGYLNTSDYLRINEDLFNARTLNQKTLFEELTPFPTASVYTPVQRGATHTLPGKIPIRAMINHFILNNDEALDRLSFQSLSDLFEKPIPEIPRYSLVALPSIDILGHHYGTTSAEAEAAYLQFDRLLAKFLQLLEKRGLRDKTNLIITNDHGMHDSGKHFPLRNRFFQAGFQMKPQNPRSKKYNVYVGDRGVSSTQLYANVTPNQSWTPLKSASAFSNLADRQDRRRDLIQFLLQQQEIDFIASRDGENSVLIKATDGAEARINCSRIDQKLWCTYEPTSLSHDPFGYCSQPTTAALCDGMARHEREWLAATADTEKPDAVLGLWQIFQSPRTGDIFIVAKPEWNFRSAKIATHGTLHQADARMILLMAGPSVTPGEYRLARSTDLFPLVRSWFNLPPRDGHDGDPLETTPLSDPLPQALANLDMLFERGPPLAKRINVQHFVRSQVIPLVSPSLFSKLIPLAKQEAKQREQSIQTLQTLKRQLSAKTPQDAAYLINEYLAQARSSVRRIEDILAVLSSCRSVESIECQRL